MFERSIDTEDIESMLKTGSVINTYPDDKPFPSILLFGFINSGPLLLVVDKDP